MVFGRGNKENPILKHTDITDKKEISEIKKIFHMLEEDERIICVAKQSKFKPGGAITSPNTS